MFAVREFVAVRITSSRVPSAGRTPRRSRTASSVMSAGVATCLAVSLLGAVQTERANADEQPAGPVLPGDADLSALPDSVSDAVTVEAQPLAGQTLLEPATESIDGLRDSPADLPAETSAEVQADLAWAEVPEAPVEVRVDQQTAAAPAEGPTEPTEGLIEEVVVEPGDGVTVSVEPGQNPATAAVLVRVEQGDTVEDDKTAKKPVSGVEVRVSYAEFRELFGGDYEQRLSITAYPACFAETPLVKRCAAGVHVPSEVEEETETIRFTTSSLKKLKEPKDSKQRAAGSSTRPSSGPAPGSRFGSAAETPGSDIAMVYAVSSTSSGSETLSGHRPKPVRSSAEWQVGTGSGDFGYSFAFDAPAAFAGPTPGVSVAYSSGAVDGMTKVENSQSTQAGLGWAEPVPAYITRSFAWCVRDGGPDGTPQGPEEPDTTMPDQCWKTGAGGDVVNEFNLIVEGRSAVLVRDVDRPVTTTTWGQIEYWRMRQDDGWRVQRITRDGSGAGNFDADEPLPQNAGFRNEAFRVTSPEGTIYWFGLDAAVSNETDSVWTVPVYGNDAGEPCHATNPTYAPGSGWCNHAWRFNVDRMIDARGNKTEYDYREETNTYARYFGPNSNGANTTYSRGGYLERIDYGWDRAANVFRQRVEFATIDRCVQQLQATPTACAAGATNWPDVPLDLDCELQAAVCPRSTSFYSKKRYSQVTTKVLTGSTWTAPADVSLVDTWVLAHTLPDPDGVGDDVADLWLAAITRTGHRHTEAAAHSPATDKELRPTVFGGLQVLPGLVDANGSTRDYEKYRLSFVRNPDGGRVTATYGHAPDRACDAAYVAGLARWASDRECFAQRYGSTDALTDTPKYEWFHKYVVLATAVTDDAIGTAATLPSTRLGSVQYTDYQYVGAPAWRLEKQRNADIDYEAWSDWRGYETTRLKLIKADGNTLATGTDAAKYRSITEIRRYRGMSQTPASINGTPGSPNQAYVPHPVRRLTTREHGGSLNEPVDQPHFSGRTAETTRMDGASTVIDRTYTDWAAILTVLQFDSRAAHIIYPQTTRSYTAVTGASPRVTTISRTVNDGAATPLLAGVETRVANDRGTPNEADDICTWPQWEPVVDPAIGDEWIRVANRSTTYDAKCAATETTQATSSRITSRVVSSYSAQGLPEQRTDWINETGTDTIVTATTYDTYGRPLTSTDGNGGVTRTAYNPNATNNSTLTGPLTSTRTVNPAGHVITTQIAPAVGEPTQITDANGQATRMTYDGLGRPTAVASAGNTTSEPNLKFSYTEYNGDTTNPQPAKVTTETRLAQGANTTAYVYEPTVEFYDGWGRVVETQRRQPGALSGRIVTLTGYDDQGQVRYAMPAVANAGTMTAPLNPTAVAVPFFTETTYDAVGRPTDVKTQNGNGTTVSTYATTATTYRGDKVITDPPAGGHTINYLDPSGRTSRVELLSGTTTSGPIIDATTYSYTDRDELAGLTKNLTTGANPGTYTWSYNYDLLGRQTQAADPDTGLTRTTYDDNNNPRTTLTAGGQDVNGQPTDLDAKIETTYDPLNRPTKRSDITDVTGPDTSAAPVLTTWVYDDPAVANSTGRVTATNQHLATTGGLRPTTGEAGIHTTRVLAYDVRGNATSSEELYPTWLTGEAGTATDGRVSKVTGQTYTLSDQPRLTTYPAEPGGLPANSVLAEYTTGGALLTMRSTTDAIRLADITYNNIGQTQRIYTSGDTGTDFDRNYGYEAATRRLNSIATFIRSTPTSSDAVTTFAEGHEFDQVSNPPRTTTITNTGASSTASTCYTYDALNRLASARTGTQDPNVSGSNGCLSPTTTAAQTQVRTALGALYNLTYTHTADALAGVTSAAIGTGLQPNGNPAGSATYTYDNDSPHQATAVQTPATQVAGNPALPTQTHLTYDAIGRVRTHIEVGVPASGGASQLLDPVRAYTYDPLGNLAAEGLLECAATSCALALASLADSQTGTDLESNVDGLFNTTGLDTFLTGLNDYLTKPTAQGGLGLNLKNGLSTTHAYRPDGTRLARRDKLTDGASTTLYRADGTELVCPVTNAVVGACKATRSYATQDGVPLATQTNGGYTFLAADSHHSIRVTRAWNGSSHTFTPTHYYPFGAPTPSSINATGALLTPNERGYLNKTHDRNGDIRLDRRHYTPFLNVLTTPDELLDPKDPQNLNPYSYSGNNPLARSDPSGLRWENRTLNQGSPGTTTTTANTGSAPATGLGGGGGGAGLSLSTIKGVFNGIFGEDEKVSLSRPPLELAEPRPEPIPTRNDEREEEEDRYLYHYTTYGNLTKILASLKLLASTGRQNARHGPGVYFTDIKPGTRAPQSLSMALVRNRIKGSRFTHYVRVDVSDLPIEKKREEVYLYPTITFLDITERLAGFGSNEQ